MQLYCQTAHSAVVSHFSHSTCNTSGVSRQVFRITNQLCQCFISQNPGIKLKNNAKVLSGKENWYTLVLMHILAFKIRFYLCESFDIPPRSLWSFHHIQTFDSGITPSIADPTRGLTRYSREKSTQFRGSAEENEKVSFIPHYRTSEPVGTELSYYCGSGDKETSIQQHISPIYTVESVRHPHSVSYISHRIIV